MQNDLSSIAWEWKTWLTPWKPLVYVSMEWGRLTTWGLEKGNIKSGTKDVELTWWLWIKLSHARKRRSRKDSGLYIHNNKKKNWGTRLWYTHQTFSVLLALSVSSRISFFCGRNLLYIFPLYYLTSEKCGFRGRKLFTVSRMWNR